MRKMPGRKSMEQKGFSLLWVIAAITTIAALGAGVVSVTTRARTNETMLPYDNQARFLAESGINYALSTAKDVMDGTNTLTMASLNNKTISTGTGQQIALTVTGPTNGWDYTVTSTGTVNSGSPFAANYSVTNIINAPSFSAGTYVVESRPGTVVVTPTGLTINTSSINDFSGGISFNPTNASPVATRAAFTNGVAPFGAGIRAYFTFQFSTGSNADGVIFAVKNAGLNTIKDCGGPPAGTSHGSFLGYSGPGYPFWGNGMGLRPPKFGIEFDFYQNSGNAGACDDGRNDPDNHHIANVFWGKIWNITAANFNDAATCPTYDDNVHGVGGANTTADPDPMNPSSGDGTQGFYTIPNRNQMVGTASPVPIRMEIIRSTTPVGGHGSTAGMYSYRIKTWYNCTAVGCNNVTADYAGGAPTLDYTVYLTSAMHTNFTNFIYGYQLATGAQTANYTFTFPIIGLR